MVGGAGRPAGPHGTEGDVVPVRLRAALAAVALGLGAILVPAAAVAVWGRWVVLDTGRYTATVAPLAHDELVRLAVRDRLVTAALDAVDVERLAGRLVSALVGGRDSPELDQAQRIVAAVLAERLVAFVTDVVDDALASPAFARAWESANRAAHAELVAVLRGDETTLVRTGEDGAISVDLASVADAVGATLTARGLQVADRVTGDLGVPLVDAAAVRRLRGAYTLVDVAAWALPLAAALMLVVGVLLARRRPRASALGAAGVAAATALALAALVAVRARYVAAATGSGGARRAVFDQLSGSLRMTLWVLLVCALVAAVGAWWVTVRRHAVTR